MGTQSFRANVGVIVSNRRGEVLAFQRADRPGQWQLPQGGLQKNEEPLEAALRELEEETGLRGDQVKLVDEYPQWLAYELPPEVRTKKLGRGQVQKFFLFQLKDDNLTIRLDHTESGELDDVKWTSLADLAQETWIVRRHAYRQLATHFAERLA